MSTFEEGEAVKAASKVVGVIFLIFLIGIIIAAVLSVTAAPVTVVVDGKAEYVGPRRCVDITENVIHSPGPIDIIHGDRK